MFMLPLVQGNQETAQSDRGILLSIADVIAAAWLG
jgi:hypothetical protein